MIAYRRRGDSELTPRGEHAEAAGSLWSTSSVFVHGASWISGSSFSKGFGERHDLDAIRSSSGNTAAQCQHNVSQCHSTFERQRDRHFSRLCDCRYFGIFFHALSVCVSLVASVCSVFCLSIDVDVYVRVFLCVVAYAAALVAAACSPLGTDTSPGTHQLGDQKQPEEQSRD